MEQGLIKKWRRRLRWPAIVVGLLAVLLYGVLPLIATPILRGRLQKQISTLLNAELRMGGVYYVFPYGLLITDAALVGRDEHGAAVDLLTIPRLKLALAKLPFGDGPLVFRKVILERPAIHMLSTEGGMVGKKGVVKAEAWAEAAPATQPTTQVAAAPATQPTTQVAATPTPASQPASPPTGERRWKPSEMFELERFAIIDGSIIYEDRNAPQTVPAVWRHINIDLATTPMANPIYQFDFKGSHAEMSDLAAAGTFNVDDLEVVVTKITAKTNLQAGAKESPLPSIFQKMLLDNRVSGNFSISGKARAPLRKLEDVEFDVHVDLLEGSARVARWQSEKDPDQNTFDRINGRFRCSSEPLTEEQVLMAGAANLRGADAGPATRPLAKLPASYLLVESAEIVMGDSVLSVKNAAAAYDRRLSEWQVKQAHGVLTLGLHKEDLPKPLRVAVEKPHFFGVIDLAVDGQGSTKKPKGGRLDYSLKVKATCPQLTLTPRKLVWTNVSVNMLMTPGLVQFLDEDGQHPAMSADLYGGKMLAHGTIRTGKPAHYDFAGSLGNVDLREFAKDWTKSDEKLSKLSGKAFATLRLSMSGGQQGRSVLDSLGGNGVVEIQDGEFYELPVLSEIGAVVAMNKDAGKVGQAAAKFSAANRTIQFEKIAVAAPILGLHGSGKARFDGSLDFRVVAAPLSDWKKAMQNTRIPLLDSVGAELLGGVQKILDSATGKMLYQLHITGKTTKPVVNTEPVPILTEDGVRVLKEMLKGTGKLVDSM